MGTGRVMIEQLEDVVGRSTGRWRREENSEKREEG